VTQELLEQVRALAPWHMSVALTPDLRTVAGNRGSGHGADHSIPLINPAELRPLLQWLYPKGLAGKRFLDCACNAGGYSLLASDLGAYSFGFDVRDHWINQARFLKRHFGKSDDQVEFEVCDLLDVDERLGSEHFDICLFKGIFYHLPDPVAGLKIVADRTDEVLILDTAAASGMEDGFLKLVSEGVDNPMSGVHGLAWHPSGPAVLSRILEWLGFEASLVLLWRQYPPSDRRSGRIRIVGARNASLLPELATPPTPVMLVPRDGDILSGARKLRASTRGNVIDVTNVEFHLTGADHDTALVGVARPTWLDWIYKWDTTAVRNGTYTLSSLAFNFVGDVGRSTGITITVQN
jgi:tRNA (mo5U34)-methyltransferase